MTLYTQALTYAINNIDNLCYYFETEIEKHLEEKTYLTDCTYFTLGLSLKDNQFVPHVIEADETEMPGTFNYNRIILTEDYLKNIKDYLLSTCFQLNCTCIHLQSLSRNAQ